MPSRSSGGAEHEAHVRSSVAADALPDATVDEHGLTVLRVKESDKAEPDPLHAGPDKLGLPDTPFDPNAALRNKLNRGPGLQDSEAKNPAVWVDQDADAARKTAAEAHVQDAQRNLDAAKERAKSVKAGDPLDQEVR